MDAGLKQTPVPVIGCGPGWLVVDKPSGVSIHNQPGIDLCAMLSRHLHREKSMETAISYDPAFGLHAVHRLDKETSGIILLACRREVFHHFSLQFAQGLVSKQYLALVHGSIPQTHGQGLWQWPLTPKAAGRRNLQGQGKRSPSRTPYQVLRHSPHYTLVACSPLTGRTHQIRRHAALAGHPLVGDQRYGSLRACRYVARHHEFTRLALHAHLLAIKAPGSEKLQKFESPGLPSEIKMLIHEDRETDGGLCQNR